MTEKIPNLAWGILLPVLVLALVAVPFALVAWGMAKLRKNKI